MTQNSPGTVCHSVPSDGFLFPVFSDRTPDVNAVMYYAKNAKKPNASIVQDVLDCEFTLSSEGEKTVLKLESGELRNSPDDESAYAVITGCIYEDDKLTVVENYAISGEKTEVLERTKNSVYGDITRVDDILNPLINGKWECSEYKIKMGFDNGKVKINMNQREKENYICMKYNCDKSGKMYIRNADPSDEAIGGLVRVYYENGCIYGTIPVCDAPSIQMVLKKVK